MRLLSQQQQQRTHTHDIRSYIGKDMCSLSNGPETKCYFLTYRLETIQRQ